MFPRKMNCSTPTRIAAYGGRACKNWPTDSNGISRHTEVIATDSFVAGARHNGSMPQYFSFLRTTAVSVSWQQRLGGALTEEEIVRLAKDYLASWTPEELAKLPLNCRPGAIKDGEDVASYAFAMVHRQCMAGPQETELHRMAAFFSAASHRISQILAAVTTSAANQERA